ncbi:MAG TPA: hypothetical protein VLC98_10830 [Phnomibacter sp.]|nr:hypothetical protein [Phnomibacter sp.]
MKKAIVFTLITAGILAISSCYKNYYDVSESTLSSINSVSFRSDVVPIVTAGGCGCHNNGTTRQIKFSWNDTIYYSTIQSRASMFDAMAKGGPHPGEGSLFFTPSQASIIIKWVEQGAKDDYVPPPVTGDITYSQHIVPLYKSDCTGSSCHGGAARTLDYTYMVNHQETLTKMMNSLGSSGHPGGPISIAPATANTFLAWMAQGCKP